MQKNINDWTVFFLIEAVEKFTAEVALMLSDLLSIKQQGEAKVSVVLCISGKANSIIATGLPYERNKGEKPDGHTTAFYKLEFDESGKASFLYFGKKINFNIHKVKDITEFIRTVVLSRNRAHKYLLFTWDHGSVFGIFKDFETLGDKGQEDASAKVDGEVKDRAVYLVSNNGVHNVGIIEGQSLKFNKTRARNLSHEGLRLSLRQIFAAQKVKHSNKLGFNILTMTDLSRAIRHGILRKIDVLVMMNCCMQYFDTGYELRYAANYLVAPETIMDFYGYNYSSMLNYLYNYGSDANGLDIAIKTIDFYEKKTYATPELTEHILNSSAIFANELSYYKAIGYFINKIAAKLLALPEDQFETVIQTRLELGNIPSVGTYNLLDFFTFIEGIRKIEIFNKDADILSLLEFKEKLVRRAHIGADTRVNEISQQITPSGFSVYFPLDKNFHGDSPFFKTYVSPQSRYAAPFSKSSTWPAFIVRYVKNAPNPPLG